MSKPTKQLLAEFANALQLSIKTKVSGVNLDDSDLIIEFESKALPDDTNFFHFLNIFGEGWVPGQKNYTIRNSNNFNWPKIILFLLLTRMNKENILGLVEIDPSMEEVTKQLGLKIYGTGLDSVKKCSQFVFEKLEDKKMTIRELAEKAGLTQVSISNFKAGGDIKLSNLLKIIKATGLKLRIR